MKWMEEKPARKFELGNREEAWKQTAEGNHLIFCLKTTG